MNGLHLHIFGSIDKTVATPRPEFQSQLIAGSLSSVMLSSNKATLLKHTTYISRHILAIDSGHSSPLSITYSYLIPTDVLWASNKLSQPLPLQPSPHMLLCFNEHRSARSCWQTTSVRSTTSLNYLCVCINNQRTE